MPPFIISPNNVFLLIGSWEDPHINLNNNLLKRLSISLGSSSTGARYQSLLEAMIFAIVALPVRDKFRWQLSFKTFSNLSKTGPQLSAYLFISLALCPKTTPNNFLVLTHLIPHGPCSPLPRYPANPLTKSHKFFLNLILPLMPYQKDHTKLMLYKQIERMYKLM